MNVMMRFYRAIVDGLKCALAHEPDGPHPLSELQPSMQIAATDPELNALLREEGMLPPYKCKRCGEWLQFRRTNRGWQAISLEDQAAFIAIARMRRMHRGLTSRN